MRKDRGIEGTGNRKGDVGKEATEVCIQGLCVRRWEEDKERGVKHWSGRKAKE